MNEIKERILHEIIKLGKGKPRLRMPALVAAALFLAAYHGIRSFLQQFRRHPVRQRVLSCLMVMALLAGQLGAATVLAGNESGQASTPVPLKKLSGSGEGFMYYHFQETTEFETGITYAFLNDIYGYEDAVTMLGSGAILEASDEANPSQKYLRNWYGDSASIKVYVNVITKGQDFDWCQGGGLYEVPGSGTPVEYRYFCWGGAARNCGPLYAYTYETAALSWENVSASLNSIDGQGSSDPEDYTVTLAYDGNTITLDPASYSVRIGDSDEVTIVVEDSDGNQIETLFQGPLAVRYDGNATEVSDVPGTQETWKGKDCTLSDGEPARDGYAFLSWKDEETGILYGKGETISSIQRSLYLTAQWADVQAPVVEYRAVQVVTRTPDADVLAAVKKALTVTDNEPVSECSIEVTGSNIAMTAGDKTVTVRATDKAGNVTEKKLTVSVVALPVEFREISFAEDTQTLSAVLYEPGSDTITETGFVWGVMNSPTVTLNNGKAATASPVTLPDSTVSVTAENLQKGVTYYARAYAIADDVTYYSNEITVGLGMPAYGTFTIKNNNDNTFTVTRSGGSEGTQTVYFRTVNGSAVGGTHFTHQAATLTFGERETSKTIRVTEKGVNAAYGSYSATAYSNADRTYQVELYRVEGGGSLGTDTCATRTMAKDSGYTIDRTVYTTERSVTNVAETSGRNGQRIADTTNAQGGSADSVSFLTNRYNEINYHAESTLSSFYTDNNLREYLKKTASGWYYRYDLYAYEYEDGYEHAYLGTQALEDKNYSLSSATAAVSGASGQLWACNFQQGQQDDPNHYYFPDTRTNGAENNGYPYRSSGTPVSYNGHTYVSLGIDQTCYAYFGSTGSNTDIWYVDGLVSYALPRDEAEPQLVTVAPMAGGLYKVGDTFTVALIFDEIVDSRNSADLQSVSLNTTWGPATYAGGADTNVLYFTGTVVRNAGSTLTVNSISNAENIMDMCDVNGTVCAGGSGSTAASVDTATPDFSVTSEGIASGTGTAVITVNTDKTKTSGLRYAWSDSAVMPTGGWVELDPQELAAARSAAGLPLSVRKEPGSGSSNGKWYLHVIGTYSTTGATTYAFAVLDFGTAENPAAGSTPPALTVSTDNTAWAKSRTVAVAASGGDTLKYRVSGADSWTALPVGTGSVTVTENGYYTFMLTAGDQTITKSIQVENIDRTAPTAEIGSPAESGTAETAKAGVYTALTLPAAFGDEQSGVEKVEYMWAGTASAAWSTLPVTATQISYTASEATETEIRLLFRITDQVGNQYMTSSPAYTVISGTAVEDHAPGISLTGAPAEWTNDMPTLIWELTDYEGKKYVVTLPNGKTAATNKGEFLVTRNGEYTVKVVDLDYGGEHTATLTVDKIDVTAPVVTVSGAADGWTGSGQTVALTAGDSASGVGKTYYKVVNTNSVIPQEGLTEISAGGGNISLEEDGVWYIYYKSYDNAGEEASGREGNRTEGFSDPIRIDTAEPELMISGGETSVLAEGGLALTLEATYGYSGGEVTLDGSTIGALTAAAGSSKISKNTECTLKQKGDYSFMIESGAGKTETKSVTVYEAVLDARNGSSEQTWLAVSGGRLSAPEEPELQGYDFAGWYTAEEGGSRWDFANGTVSADLKLYAHWMAKGDTAYMVRHWTQNMDGTQDAYDSSSYTLYRTESRKGATGGSLALSDLGICIPGCSYALGKSGGSVVTEVSILADGSLEVDLYYHRESIPGTVTVTGEAVAGENLTAETSGTPEEESLEYQWYYVGENGAEDRDIPGAAGKTYSLTVADLGKKLGVRVTAQDHKGQLTAVREELVTARLSGELRISGKAVLGSTLTLDVTGLTPSGAPVSYRWYRVNGEGEEELTDVESDTYTLTAADLGYVIKAVAEGTGYCTGSVWTTTAGQVGKKAQVAPTGITHTNETIDRRGDGQIHGLDASRMEYRAGTEGDYQDFPAERFSEGTLSGLAAGDYQIRFRETAECRPSDPVTVTVEPGRRLSVALPETQKGYVLKFEDGSDGQVSYGGSLSLRFALRDGYFLTGDFAVTLSSDGGVVEDMGNGSYRISGITGDAQVQVSGVAEAPKDADGSGDPADGAGQPGGSRQPGSTVQPGGSGETDSAAQPGDNGGGCFWHWLILGAVLLGIAATAATVRRRSRKDRRNANGAAAPAVVAVATSVLAVLFAVLGSCVLDWIFAAGGILVMGAVGIVGRKT